MGFFGDVLSHAWNAFTNRDPTTTRMPPYYGYYGSSSHPDRIVLSKGNERSIINGVFNRIGIDVAANTFQHVKLDSNGRFKEEINDGINKCLNVEANIDQTGRSFIQDIVMSMLDEGVVAVVPIDTDLNPAFSLGYDIETMRVGKVVEWYPQHVKIQVYNDRNGKKEERVWSKRNVALIENPFYAVMNEPNSTGNRLLRKLSLMDIVDERNYSGKLDLIIQLPYSTRTELRKNQAKERLKDIQNQLTNSPYGIAYTDSTEKIIQLNRSLENNFMKQIEFFQNMFYSQMGITQAIMDGSADTNVLQNYNKRTIEPICSAIIDELKRKFLTKNAITRGESFFVNSNPFKLIPIEQVAEIADKFTRNEIFTSNEVRQILGIKPSTDPNADVLRNKNINQTSEDSFAENQNGETEDYDTSMQQLDDIDGQIAELEKLL